MNLKMTAKANGATEETYIAAGWTQQQLVDNGLAVAVSVAAREMVKATPATRAPVTPDGTPPNVLGVLDLNDVEALFNAYSPIRFFPGGYSHAQQILHVANHLAAARGVK